MQHHGAPTRLLDWSTSIYVAAYFAVIEQPNADGVIWIVHLDTVRNRMIEKYLDGVAKSVSELVLMMGN